MTQKTRQFSLKVLTINTHKGFTAFNKRFILPELRDAVRTVGADIVCLQEVLGAHEVHLVALHALEPHPDVGLDVLHDVADVERAVGVGQGRGDEEAPGHGGLGVRAWPGRTPILARARGAPTAAANGVPGFG